MRVHQQAAYVLLNRPYSESSWIVEVFSREYGRLSLMAKGARRIKSKLKGVLIPFQPLLVSWSGKGEIPTLTSAEIDQTKFDFINHEMKGDSLVCGFYCNELLVNLLHRHDPHISLYDHYQSTLTCLGELSSDSSVANILREFEQVIIRETGYEVSFEFEAGGMHPIAPNENYYFQASKGFVRIDNQVQSYQLDRSIAGHLILALNQNSIDLKPSELSQTKHLMREILIQLIGNRKIVSRELFLPKLRN